MEAYLEKHNVRGLMEWCTTKLVLHRPDHPLKFLHEALGRCILEGGSFDAGGEIARSSEKSRSAGPSRTRLRLKSALATDAELQGFLSATQKHTEDQMSVIDKAHQEASQLASNLKGNALEAVASNHLATLSAAAQTASDQRAKVVRCEVEVKQLETKLVEIGETHEAVGSSKPALSCTLCSAFGMEKDPAKPLALLKLRLSASDGRSSCSCASVPTRSKLPGDAGVVRK